MSQSSDSLQEYLNSLLNDTFLNDKAIAAAKAVADEQTALIENALKLAAGSNVAPLPTTRAARPAAQRTYAEPIRTLNLRMPLPPIAEAVPSVVETAVETEIEIAVETPIAVETQPAVEIAQEIVTQPVEAKVDVPAISETLSTPLETRIDISTTIPPETSETHRAASAQSTAATSANLATMAAPAAWLSNGRPQWAQQPFECLIFKAGGLQLAAPLVELGSIYPLENDALTEIFGQKQWFMGLLPIKEYNVRTMDTALVVMPERYSEAMREQYRYVISLFGSDWGLAVDAVVGTTLLDPERVRWRGERSKRPWLAGTLVDQMCALFDIAQLAWLFHGQDRKRASK